MKSHNRFTIEKNVKLFIIHAWTMCKHEQKPKYLLRNILRNSLTRSLANTQMLVAIMPTNLVLIQNAVSKVINEIHRTM